MKDSVKITLIVSLSVVLIVGMSLVYSFEKEKILVEKGLGKGLLIKDPFQELEQNNKTVKTEDLIKDVVKTDKITDFLNLLQTRLNMKSEIKDTVFDYRFSLDSIKTLSGKRIFSSDTITDYNKISFIESVFNSLGFKLNDSNTADGVSGGVFGFNSSDIACLTYRTNNENNRKQNKTAIMDLEIKCAEIK